MGIIEILFNAEVIKIFGPFAIVLLLLSFALYKMFKMYVEVQEKRIQEAKEIQKEYELLANDINKTMDTLIALLSKKRK